MDEDLFELESFEENEDPEFQENEHENVQQDVEFIILYGPPCGGKTLFYKQNYAQRNHIRVCPSELFSDSPKLSLHKIMNVILRHMKEGRSVVLDDTLHTSLERTRRSYINAIKNKLPSCKIIGIKIESSLAQCLWSREYALAERTVLYDLQGKTISPLKYNEPEIENWFLHRSDPSLDEGYQEIREVNHSLTVNSVQSALLIDSKSILSIEDDQVSIVKEAALVMNEWKQQNTNGRIIVLIDESNLYPASLELHRDSPLQQKLSLDQFREYVRIALQALHLTFPIYYLRSDYDILESEHFFRPPKPGMIAWLQYRHKLDLKNCLYIDSYDSKKCGEVATSIGMSFCPSDLFWKSNSWTIASKIRKYARDTSINTPFFLKKMQYLLLPSNSTLREPLNSLPLDNHNKQMNEDFNRGNNSKLTIPCVEERGGVGRVHGVVFPGNHFKNSRTKIASLQIQNGFIYLFILTHLEKENSQRISTPKQRNLPDWMTGNNETPLKKRKSSKKSLSDSAPTHSNNNSNNNSNSYDESSNDSQSSTSVLKKQKLRHSYDSSLSSTIVKQEPVSLVSPPSSPLTVTVTTPLQSVHQSSDSLSINQSDLSDFLTPMSAKKARSIHLDQLLGQDENNEDSNDRSEETSNISLQDLLQRHIGTSSFSAFDNVSISRDANSAPQKTLSNKEKIQTKKVSLKALLEL